jgi:hypothetical protein
MRLRVSNRTHSSSIALANSPASLHVVTKSRGITHSRACGGANFNIDPNAHASVAAHAHARHTANASHGCACENRTYRFNIERVRDPTGRARVEDSMSVRAVARLGSLAHRARACGV